MLRALISEGLAGMCPFDEKLLFSESKRLSLIPGGAKTIITVLFPYNTGELLGRNAARYACVSDYHRVVGEILGELTAELKSEYPGEEFEFFIDASPVREVAAACACGLGAKGLNGMLIHKKYGSTVFIGCVVTTLEIPCKALKEKACLMCGACIAACTENALQGGKPLIKERCRSYISQKKGELCDAERAAIKSGGMAIGCDICADACPLNENAATTRIEAFYKKITPVLSRENIDEAVLDKPFGRRGRDIILRNLAILEE